MCDWDMLSGTSVGKERKPDASHGEPASPLLPASSTGSGALRGRVGVVAVACSGVQ